MLNSLPWAAWSSSSRAKPFSVCKWRNTENSSFAEMILVKIKQVCTFSFSNNYKINYRISWYLNMFLTNCQSPLADWNQLIRLLVATLPYIYFLPLKEDLILHSIQTLSLDLKKLTEKAIANKLNNITFLHLHKMAILTMYRGILYFSMGC